MSTTFYKDLPILESFIGGVDTKAHTDLPDDWLIVMTDVVGSTKAIERGEYKHVNSLGVASIVSIVNVDRSVEIPYVFGGDGCTCAIPPHMERGAREALLGCKVMALEAFKLELRCSIIPVTEIKKSGSWLKVGKLRTSEHMTQPALSGRGWDDAEAMLKDPATRDRFEVLPTDGLEPNADFSGYECRWQGVDARRGGMLCALIRGLDVDAGQRVELYQDVLAAIDRLCGSDEASSPVKGSSLALSLWPRPAWNETRLRFHGKPFFFRVLRFARAYAEIIAGRLLMSAGFRQPVTDWSKYRDVVAKNTDRRKFDGALRVVLDCSDAESATLAAYLEEQRKAGRLVYGLHRSTAALITCMVLSYDNAHYHFLDGADGGYAMAARQLKEQLRAIGLK